MARSGSSDCAQKNQCHQARETLVATFERFQDRHCIEDSQHADHHGVVYREALGERGCDSMPGGLGRQVPIEQRRAGPADPYAERRVRGSTKLSENCSNMADQRALR